MGLQFKQKNVNREVHLIFYQGLFKLFDQMLALTLHYFFKYLQVTNLIYSS